MSLVESALRKMQAGRRAATPEPPPPERESPSLRPLLADRPTVPDGPRVSALSAIAERNADRRITMDRDALREAGLLPPVDQERTLLQQYRGIKRPLIKQAFENPGLQEPSPQLIMIAGALPGGGKTFTSVNLAFSMARERDHSVLLVDADLLKPHISAVLGVATSPGLLDVLADPSLAPESVILPTDIPGLCVLPAGARSDASPELLASTRMQDVLHQLMALDPAGIVLFDSPPILLTADAVVLASLVGQIVLVVDAGSTPQHAVKDTISLLGEDKSVSLVLNRAQLDGPLSYYYGYGYGSAYGYGYGEAGNADATRENAGTDGR